MADCAQSNEPPLFNCSDDPQWHDDPPTGCGNSSAYLIFLSFTLIVSFVMMNLFVAVILGARLRAGWVGGRVLRGSLMRTCVRDSQRGSVTCPRRRMRSSLRTSWRHLRR